MQSEATEVVDLSRETAETLDMYGINDAVTSDFGRKCLITRRLIERGVRYIQLYSGGGHIEDTWDGHNDCIKNHTTHAAETDKPIAALMTDLKRTGLWDETLLVWGGEFGRTPTSEGVGKPGRDHDWHGFSMWLAGAGVKGGQAIGATDELGFKAVEDRLPCKRSSRDHSSPDGTRSPAIELPTSRARPAFNRRRRTPHRHASAALAQRWSIAHRHWTRRA